MEVVLPLNETTTQSVSAQQRLVEQLALEQRATNIGVPTSDELIKLRLKELEEPIIYFGETKAERRQRLKLTLAQRGLTQGMPMGVSAAQAEAAERGDDFDIERPYSSEGSLDLRVARLWILRDSLERAQRRLTAAKAAKANATQPAESDGMDVDVPEAAQDPLAYVKKFTGIASELGDDRPLSSIRFNPNGDLLAVASWSGLCKVWSAENYSCKMTLRGHSERIQHAVWHPASGSTQSAGALNLVTGGADRSIRFWNLEKETAITALTDAHEDRINKIAFHPSGNYIATSSFDTKWNLWDVEKGKLLLSQEGHSRPTYGIAFQCDGALVCTTGLDAFARIWDIRIGKTVSILRGHAKQVLAVDWHPNGFVLATGSDDHTVRVWDMRKKATLNTLVAHTGLVSDVAFQPGTGDFLVSSGYDSKICIWSGSDLTLTKMLPAHDGKVTGVHIQPLAAPGQPPKYLASCGFDRTWKLWGHEELF
jgi:U4/U6 small nuclear ribonucleoprotein PRP4